MVDTRKRAQTYHFGVSGTGDNGFQPKENVNPNLLDTEKEVTSRRTVNTEVSRSKSKSKSRHSTSSQIRIDELEEVLRQRDEALQRRDEIMQEQKEEIEALRRAMQEAGILEGEKKPVKRAVFTRVTESSESESERVSDEEDKQRKNGYGKVGSTYKMFMDCKPTPFKGSADPIVCMRWVRKMNQVFNSGEFTERQKVNYAIRMLEDEADDWWSGIADKLSKEIFRKLTWTKFAEKVVQRFYSRGAILGIEREFMELKKGNQTIA